MGELANREEVVKALRKLADELEEGKGAHIQFDSRIENIAVNSPPDFELTVRVPGYSGHSIVDELR